VLEEVPEKILLASPRRSKNALQLVGAAPTVQHNTNLQTQLYRIIAISRLNFKEQGGAITSRTNPKNSKQQHRQQQQLSPDTICKHHEFAIICTKESVAPTEQLPILHVQVLNCQGHSSRLCFSTRFILLRPPIPLLLCYYDIIY
jgi:hypothetical protein